MTVADEPAGELVASCARAALDDGEPGRVEDLAADRVDWEVALELARREGVTPLVHRALRKRDDVPADVRDTLRQRARAVATRNLLAARELCAIVSDLEAAGIPALPFKGPPLAVAAYGDLALREFVDLDVLVPAGDVSRAVDRLESTGYEWFAGAPRLDDAAVLGGRFTPPLAPEFRLHRDDACVEVRYQVGERSRPVDLDFGALWPNREPVDLAGTTVQGLGVEDRLLVLAYHGVKHRWARLKWVCDVAAAVAAADGLDWDGLVERAGRVGARRRLLVALGVAVELLDADVPASVVREVREDRLAPWLVARAVDRRHPGDARDPEDGPDLWYNVLASDSLRAAMAPVVHAPWYSPGLAEYRVKPLPGPLHALYYPLRPLRGFAVALRRVLGGWGR